MTNRTIFLSLVIVLCLLAFSVSVAKPRLVFSVDDIHNPLFQTRSVTLRIQDDETGARQLNIDIESVTVHDYVLQDIKIACRAFQLTREEIACRDGQMTLRELFAAPVALRFSATRSELTVRLQPEQGEHWQFSLRWDASFWQAVLAVEAGNVLHAARWMPDRDALPKLTNGRINGTLQFDGDMQGLMAARAQLSVDELAFADAAGTRAGEDIQLIVTAQLHRDRPLQHWSGHSDIHWSRGAVFWQPLFFAAAEQHLNVQGVFDGTTLRLQHSQLILPEIGAFRFGGTIGWPDFSVNRFKLDADNLAVSALFEQTLKPFLVDTMLAEVEITGHGDFALRVKNNAIRSVDLDLDDVTILDKRDRFAFHRINVHIPWQADNATVADISLLKGHLLHIPLGSVRVPLEINDFSIFLPQLALPVLDGHLMLEDFSAVFAEGEWHWEFGGNLTPVSMESLTAALQIQQMHGELSGFIPEVRYDGKSVTVNGVLQINVFDGSVVIHRLKLIEPLGIAPHLTADMAMRNLDLGLLTRTFSFGKVEGRVDIDVNQLELANWKPIHFDAQLFSSPGRYTRRISQAAIQNISALGGEGAVVAIQRSFLRFFEEFSYSEIGWRCALRFDVCHMGGIEPEADSRYTLIKGGGIPAINVMGYNRHVSWQELINRLQRITHEHEPIIE